MQMSVESNRPVVMQNFDDIGLVEHHGSRRAAEKIVLGIDHNALTGGIHRRAVGQRDVHGVPAVGRRMSNLAREGLRDRKSRADAKWYAVGTRGLCTASGDPTAAFHVYFKSASPGPVRFPCTTDCRVPGADVT